ncbi:MAG: thymidylate synthase, partial [Candidatus Parcubacteria bacterium]|nr:thymidylate synthase [Candidatus Parcubacteria bacterium]
MDWPKYYNNQIIIPSAEGYFGIITGWSKKENINDLLSPENKNKIGAIGQLYSKEGINYIIRNLFLNPKISQLIVTGKDLSGSLKFLENFLLTGAGQEILHKEIPAEKTQQFIDWFKNNTHFIQEEKINDFLSQKPNDNPAWLTEIIDFPDAAQREKIDFPSEEICFRLEDKKIADLWLKILDRVLKFGVNKMCQYSEMQRELINVSTVINDEDPDNPYLTDYLYFNKQDLENYYPQLMTDRIFEGVEYTYGSRLRNFNGINQIEALINDLKANSYSRRAIAFTWDVMKDTGNPKSPCINLVNAIIQGDKLYLTTYMR